MNNIATLEYARRRSLMQDADDARRCALEKYYPRLMREITQLWFRNEINTYLEDLIVDERFDRQGFPYEVFDELLFLSDLHWIMTHPGAAVESRHAEMADYSFADLPHAARVA